MPKFKRGIYRTHHGSAAFVAGPNAVTAFDLDMGEKIPISEVTLEFIRKAEYTDTPAYYNSY
jgi:hypothetical protein